uniref:Uncharacterized protein n=1 Tax=Arundo donax TaxID=35708 RepID=A0A0A8Z1K2_ARUDO
MDRTHTIPNNLGHTSHKFMKIKVSFKNLKLRLAHFYPLMQNIQ